MRILYYILHTFIDCDRGKVDIDTQYIGCVNCGRRIGLVKWIERQENGHTHVFTANKSVFVNKSAIDMFYESLCDDIQK